MRDQTLRRLAVAAGLNFMVFIAADLYLGGDALNGKIENGRYFLNSHGQFTEVSQAVFIYSAAHTTSAMLGICFVIFAARRRKRNSK